MWKNDFSKNNGKSTDAYYDNEGGTMDEDKKNRGFMDLIKDGLDYMAKRILENISPPITESMERVMQNLEDRIIRIEEKAIRKIFSFAVIGLGTIFLALALFFFLREFLGWSNSAAYFSVGMLMIVIGLIIDLGNRSGGKNENSHT